MGKEVTNFVYKHPKCFQFRQFRHYSPSSSDSHRQRERLYY